MRSPAAVGISVLSTLLAFIIHVSAAQSGDCYPSSTVCCESRYTVDCSLAADGTGSKNIYKKEKRTITWPIGGLHS